MQVTSSQQPTSARGHIQNIDVMSKSTMMDEICRECIPCDGSCGRTDPSNQCERCHLSYYCSKKCQKRHWKDHREDCRGVNGSRRRAFPTRTIPLEGTNTDCAIFLAQLPWILLSWIVATPFVFPVFQSTKSLYPITTNKSIVPFVETQMSQAHLLIIFYCLLRGQTKRNQEMNENIYFKRCWICCPKQ